MAKTGRIQDFRSLNLSKQTASVKKNTGAVRAQPKKAPKRKETKNKQPKKSNGVAIFLFVLVLAGIGVGCLFTPAFDVNSVIVNTGNNVTKEEILSKVGDVEGINILKINTLKIKENIEKIPYVKNAKVRRLLPDDIEVTINERVPYCVIKYIESFMLVDKYGYVLETRKENENNLPIIYGLDVADYENGQPLIDEERIKYDKVVYLLEAAENAKFEYTITEIDYEDIDAVHLSIKDMEVEVKYGEIDTTLINDKIIKLNNILQTLKGRKGLVDISGETMILREKY